LVAFRSVHTALAASFPLLAAVLAVDWLAGFSVFDISEVSARFAINVFLATEVGQISQLI
jgi:hypothetical protein